MSYSTLYRGSPWEQGRQPFDVRGYGQMYGGYGLGNQFSSAAYSNYNLESFRRAYGSSAFSRGMGYGSHSAAGYSSDRLSSYQDLYGPVRQKRVSQRSPVRSPRIKRQRLENGIRQGRTRIRWRRRDSRRRGKSNKSDKSVESTEDTANTNYDDYDSWKSSEDENETTVTQDNKTPSANGVEKNDVETESDKTKGEKKQFACDVCKVKCFTLERLGRHTTSRTHNLKLEKLLILQKEKKQVTEASTKASKQVESRDRKGKGRKRQNQWCTVCELLFPGSFLAHRRSKEHRKMRDKKYPKCHLCRASFSNSDEYKAHCKEEKHKEESAKYHYLRSLPGGADDEIAAIEPVVNVDTPVVKQDDETAKSEEVEKSEEKKEVGDSKSDNSESAVTKENQPIGQMFVVAAKGYYCKICCKFFKDGTVAKVKHCCSMIHSEAFKKAMKKAMEQEEERQKLADQLEKLEEKAVELAHTDGLVAAAEKTAEEDTTTETAEKEHAEKDGEGESKKSSDLNDNAVVVKLEEPIVADMDNKEETKETGKEKKEGTVGGGLFKQDTGEEAKESAEKDKGSCKPLPSPAPAKAAVEQSDATSKPDSQEDKESEGSKKESPVLRGAKRGRGRGRRR